MSDERVLNAPRSPGITFTVPVRTVSALNCREHWATKARRVKAERDATRWAYRTRPTIHTDQVPDPPLVVRMTRISSGLLDDDNLAGALKGVRDEVAAMLGYDDGDPRVTWERAQEKAKRGVYGVRVTVEEGA